jgi:hypothetical protein
MPASIKNVLEELGITAHFTETSKPREFIVYLEQGRADPHENWAALRNHKLVESVEATASGNLLISRVELRSETPEVTSRE